MLKKVWSALRSAVLWTYRRGSWQYDIICALILAFIFLMPRAFFGDQPRAPIAQEIQSLDNDPSTLVFVVDATIVDAAAPAELKPTLARMLTQRTGRDLTVVDVQPTPSHGAAARSYLVYARP